MPSLTPFFLQPSDPGTREWLSFNATNYNAYVFAVRQARDHAGVWSGYVAFWSTYAFYVERVIYGPRLPTFPTEVAGTPFTVWPDMLTACQAVLDTLP